MYRVLEKPYHAVSNPLQFYFVASSIEMIRNSVAHRILNFPLYMQLKQRLAYVEKTSTIFNVSISFPVSYLTAKLLKLQFTWKP